MIESPQESVRTIIKQDLRPNLNSLDYAVWGVLENKTNATFHPNIGLLNAAIEKELNGMSADSILKACKFYRRRADTIIEKNGGHID